MPETEFGTGSMKYLPNCVTMDETIYLILKLLFNFALEVWFSIFSCEDVFQMLLLFRELIYSSHLLKKNSKFCPKELHMYTLPKQIMHRFNSYVAKVA